MLKRFTGWSVLVALTAALVTMPAATASAQNKNTNRLIVPVTGTAAGVGTVAGISLSANSPCRTATS
jgi:hypothetical protein